MIDYQLRIAVRKHFNNKLPWVVLVMLYTGDMSCSYYHSHNRKDFLPDVLIKCLNELIK